MSETPTPDVYPLPLPGGFHATAPDWYEGCEECVAYIQHRHGREYVFPF